MGTWDCGPFDNDVAMDWVDELLELESWDEIRAQLAFVVAEGWADADDGTEAVAAAEVVAAAAGRGGPELPEEAQAAVKRLPTPDAALLAAAHEAITALLAPTSELREQWEGSEDGQRWRVATEALQGRLAPR